MRRAPLLLLVLVTILGACGGDGAASTTRLITTSTTRAAATTSPATTTSSSTTTTSTSSTTTTTTTQPPDPPFIREEDRGPFVAALQSYLNCAGFGTLTVDGVFGPQTGDAVSFAQLDLGVDTTGEPTEATFAELSRRCDEERPVSLRPGATSIELGGNAAPGDDEVFLLRILRLQEIIVEPRGESPVEVQIEDEFGVVLPNPGTGGAVTADIDETGDYRLRVSAAAATSYRIEVEIPPPDVTIRDVVLADDGLQLVTFGDPADDVISMLRFALGDPAADNGWLEDEACLGGTHRRLQWSIPADGPEGVPTVLSVHLTDYDRDDRVFTDYDYVRDLAPDLPEDARGVFSTLGGITVGSSTAALESVHPNITYRYLEAGAEVLATFDGLPQYRISPAIEIGPDTDLTNLAGWVRAIGTPHMGCPEL